MSENPTNSPRAGCWLLAMPVIAIPTVVSAYIVLVWLGYLGVPAAGERVVFDIAVCDEGQEVVKGRIADMGLGAPAFTTTPDGLRAEVTLPDNPFASDIAATLAKPGHFEVLLGEERAVGRERIESASLRLDFTGEPSIAIQLDEDGARALEAAMRAVPDGVVHLRVDGEPMGDRAGTPPETRGRVTLPVTGPDRPTQVARAAELGLILARPLPCAVTVSQRPADPR